IVTISPSVPNQLIKISSTDSQSAGPNTTLPKDMQVRVLDSLNNPIPNVTVSWIPLKGGSVSASSSTTNSMGYASTQWTLHSTNDVDSLAATISGFTTTPDTVYFTAFVSSGSPDSLFAVGAVSDSGQVDSDLPIPFVVQINDSFGNPVPNAEVSFAITSVPNGAINQSLSVYTSTTDQNGRASTQLHLGSLLGSYTVRATANTTPTFVEFTGVANVPGNPDSLIIVAGNNQQDTVNTALADSLIWKIIDQFGNPVSGVTVTFTGDGSFSPSSDISDSNGLVSTSWTLGTASGSQSAIASIPAFPAVSSSTMNATGLPDSPTQIELVSLRNIGADSVT
ncbi:MAG: hypothetical protein D6732_25985, partial [Methanobacteriota archaeon]